jgi:hypothetical protein
LVHEYNGLGDELGPYPVHRRNLWFYKNREKSTMAKKQHVTSFI